jgi:hypothetical protein
VYFLGSLMFRGNLQPHYLGPPSAGFCLGLFSTLKLEVIASYETSVHIRTTRRYIPEGGNFHSCRCENIKFYITTVVRTSHTKSTGLVHRSNKISTCKIFPHSTKVSFPNHSLYKMCLEEVFKGTSLSDSEVGSCLKKLKYYIFNI